jgi:transcriptional regulator with GAF, ATPase, and Fis domain
MKNKNEELIKLAQTLIEIEDYNEIVRLANHKLFEWFNADVELITMLNPVTHKTIKTIGRKEISEYHFGKYHNINNVISGWVIKNKNVFISNNLRESELLKRFNKDKINFSTAICSPITIGNRIIGTILLLNTENKKIFNQEDQGLLENLSAVIAPYLYDYQKINEYFTSTLPDQDLIIKYSQEGLIGKSEQFITLLRSIETAAKCSLRVLLEGETGTGKEIIAKAIHNFGSRNSNKFVVLDCAAVPNHLIESEMFGHTKGAFTGAISERRGIIEEADKGTLFIDEINLLSFDIQAKLLRFIQEKEYRKVGSNEVKNVDVRIIAATSSQLNELVNSGNFRPELYYRLNVFPIVVPTLNERIKDIPILLNHFIQRSSKEQNKQVESIDENILPLFVNRKWKGNIRELENFIERLVALTEPNTKIITEKILPEKFKKELRKIKNSESINIEIKSLEETLQNYEEIILRNALIKYNWNQTKAAESLNIKEQTLRYKMNKYKIVKLNK